MKRIVLGIFMLVLAVNLNAQKIAYFTSSELTKTWSAFKKADSITAEFTKTLNSEYGYFQTELVEKQKKLSDSSKLDAGLKKVLADDIHNIEEKMQKFSTTANERLTVKRNEIFAPVIKKLQETVKALAKEKGYSIVFDVSSISMFYVDDKLDITEELKKKLK